MWAIRARVCQACRGHTVKFVHSVRPHILERIGSAGHGYRHCGPSASKSAWHTDTPRHLIARDNAESAVMHQVTLYVGMGWAHPCAVAADVLAGQAGQRICGPWAQRHAHLPHMPAPNHAVILQAPAAIFTTSMICQQAMCRPAHVPVHSGMDTCPMGASPTLRSYSATEVSLALIMPCNCKPRPGLSKVSLWTANGHVPNGCSGDSMGHCGMAVQCGTTHAELDCAGTGHLRSSVRT